MSSNSGRCRRLRSSDNAWIGRTGLASRGARGRFVAGLTLAGAGLTVGFFARIVFAGPVPRAAERLAAARLGAAGRFAAFLGALARVGRAGLAARFLLVAALLAGREGLLAERRPLPRGALRFGRLAARLTVGRFLAFLAMAV